MAEEAEEYFQRKHSEFEENPWQQVFDEREGCPSSRGQAEEQASQAGGRSEATESPANGQRGGGQSA